MQAVEALHNLGLLSFVVILLGLGLMLKTGGADVKNSLSGHAAVRRRSYAVFVAALIGGGVLFYWFVTKWLEPTLRLGLIFNIIMLLTLACELLAAIIPDSGGARSRVHRMFAWMMAYCMLPLTLLLFLAPLPVIAKVLIGTFFVYMVFDLSLYIFVKASHRYFLVFQGTYVISFYLAVLVATYIR